MVLFALNVAKYHLLLRAQDDILLPPYKGSAFRGGFGHALKRVACSAKFTDCSRCTSSNQCVYSFVFESPVPSDLKLASLNNYAPHPFVIEPPLDSRLRYSAGETLDLYLVLIGRAIEHLPHFLSAFEELGRLGIGKYSCGCQTDSLPSDVANVAGYGRATRAITGQYSLEGAWHVGPWGERPVYDTHGPLVIDPGELQMSEVFESIANEETARIDVEFITPTRIKEQGRLTSELSFPTLARALFRRLSDLAQLYCGKEERGALPELPVLAEAAGAVSTESSNLHWHDWERYSQRQQTRMKLGGVVGHVVYAGPLRQFMPYLLLGEYVHVGKNTSFGLGQMRLRRVS